MSTNLTQIYDNLCSTIVKRSMWNTIIQTLFMQMTLHKKKCVYCQEIIKYIVINYETLFEGGVHVIKKNKQYGIYNVTTRSEPAMCTGFVVISFEFNKYS